METVNDGERAGDGRLRRAALGAAIFVILLAGYLIWRTAVLTPYSDEFDLIGRWFELQGNQDGATYLLSPHNFHRLVWVMALLAVDLSVFHGTNWPLIVSGAASLVIMAGLLAVQAVRGAPAGLRTAAGSFAAMLALMPGNVLDASTPICVNDAQAAVFAVAAIVLAEGAATASACRRGAALLAAIAAAFGSAAALAAWPAMGFGALRRRDWRWLAILALAGGTFVGLYLRGQGGTGHTAFAGALGDPVSAIRLSLGLLALPWTRLAPALGWIPGAVVVVLALALVLPRDLRDASPAERCACALIMFTLAVAAMAGLGRTSAESAVDVPLRYGIFVTPLHVGVLILAMPWAGAFWRGRPTAAQACGVALLLALCAQDIFMAGRAIAVSDAIRGLIAEYRTGGSGPAVRATVYPDLARARRISYEMRQRGLFQGTDQAGVGMTRKVNPGPGG